ncbi:hypothetical protein G6F32_013365 [Rhizopus arrhizus]|nr:hypothetical protein G6F32_013365 [Rhizopus arrhizus]
MALPERHAGGHPQRAVRLGIIAGELALQRLTDLQHLPEARQRRLARTGQADPAGGPVQQARPQPAFDLGQVAADHRPGHVQHLGGRGQASALGHLDEHGHGGQSVHMLDPCNKQARYTLFFERLQRPRVAPFPPHAAPRSPAMKIALVGSTGNIGRQIARHALAHGHELTVIVRSAQDLPAELAGAHPRLRPAPGR